MPLESTMICLDNSEWMRNGDYVPTRMEAQHDAANLVCGTKTQSNPESTVGVLSMAGKGPELLVSPTDDMGKILNSLHDVPMGGKVNFAAAVQIAQLALKHRRNKLGGQRLVLFVASPVEEESKALVKVGKLLKKNNVAVDVVSMGEIDDNQAKLQDFIDAANSGDNSHLVVIPAGILPSDVLISSPIIAGEGGGMGSFGAPSAGGGAAEFGGVDPNLDPELAMALRVSMEEERARQEAAAAASSEGHAETKSSDAMDVDPSTSPTTAPKTPLAPAVAAGDDEEALLRQALAMSMNESAAVPEGMDPEEYEAMQMALQMSLDESAGTESADSLPKPVSAAVAAAATTNEGSSASSGDIIDPGFVNQLLGQLEGVDLSDPRIKAAMENLGSKQSKDGEEKKDKEG